MKSLPEDSDGGGGGGHEAGPVCPQLPPAPVLFKLDNFLRKQIFSPAGPGEWKLGNTIQSEIVVSLHINFQKIMSENLPRTL